MRIYFAIPCIMMWSFLLTVTYWTYHQLYDIGGWRLLPLCIGVILANTWGFWR